ncbi:MAG TPA: glycosyltransferase family 4 protein [Pyrinomonadaceae bacterium]|nr:glycosyltransferase family 4 protein [Pyrinomonadaceae bacterium]
MRILHISSARALGGGERHLADLVNALANRGHDVHVALAPRSPLREELSALPERNLVALPLRNALDVGSAHALARLVRRHDVEIVHAHMARDYPLAAYAARRNAQARLVITRHVLFPLSRLHTWTLSSVARVVAVSHAVARALHGQRIFAAEKISVIPNGIDTGRFDPAARGFDRNSFRRNLKIAPGRLLVGTVGEINRLKGQEEFLRAASLLAARLPRADFVIAGEDFSRTGEHRARIVKLVGELGLEGRVHLTGWLEDVAPLLCALDLFVSASRTESFGLAIVEAMASGLAVIATATEGAREIVEDGATGMLVPVGDLEALAEAIARLLEDEQARERMGQRARVAARERFSLERMVEATESIYRDALESRAESRARREKSRLLLL